MLTGTESQRGIADRLQLIYCLTNEITTFSSFKNKCW